MTGSAVGLAGGRWTAAAALGLALALACEAGTSAPDATDLADAFDAADPEVAADAVPDSAPDAPAAADDGATAEGGDTTPAPDTACEPFTMAGRVWQRFVIDDIGGAPIYPEIALDPAARPVVAYRRGTASSRYPAVARFDGAAWGAPDIIEQRDGQYLGKRPSVAVDAAGTVHVTAYDEDEMQLRYATQPTGGVWQVDAVYPPSGGDAGDHSALVVDAAGTLHVSLLEYGSYAIVYGKKGADGAWSFEPAAADGSSSALAVDTDGAPRIAYRSGGALRYATRDESGWRDVLVDDAGDVGHYPSLALDAAGRAHIVHLRWPDSESAVRVAHETADGWVLEEVDDGLGITYTTGIGVLPCGTLAVAYARNLGTGTEGLHFAWQPPGGDWQRESVDSTSYVAGIDLVVAADATVHLVYFDETAYALKHARLVRER